MTATAAPARGVPGVAPRPLDPTLVPTLAVSLVTLSVGLGFGRLFTEGRFLVPVVVTVMLSHGVAWWCRRNELPTVVAALATFGAAGLAAAWTVLGHTTAYGVPIPNTLRVAAQELDRAREAFEVVRAPTAVMPGFLVALALALGVAAFMSDWAAFRLQTAIEALVPSFTLFVFTAALGTDRYRLASVVLYAATALAFLVVYGMSSRTRLAWFGGRPANGPGTIVRGAIVLAAAAILTGLVVSPALPGYGDDPMLQYKNRGRPGPSSRSTVSPLVDIRGRLIERANVEVFTVATNARSYWRLTSLDTFDGSIWSSNATYRPTRGALGTQERLTGGIAADRSRQEVTISSLDSIWLPAAYRPIRVSEIEGVSYNPDTASLITEDETTDGYTYVVESAVPRYSPEQLDTAPARAPAAVAERYLALPDISDRVEQLARRIVANQPTPYRRAKALQDFFHKGDFTYSLSERQGHDSAALENFLFRNRRGYCEQYAGAFGVMARAVGLPTRIAVGFTAGELREDGTYHVRDEHAHAWPEVYLDGYGWVQFEPTVGRGAPNAESWTGRPEQQDVAGEATTATTATSTPTSTPEGQVPTPTQPDAPELGEDGSGATIEDDRPDAALLVVFAAFGLLAVYALVVPFLHLLRLRRRHRRMEGQIQAEVAEALRVADRVLASWSEASEALARAGVRRRPSETMLEFGSRAPASAGLQPEAAGALRALCRDTTDVSYAPESSLDDGAGDRASRSAVAVRDAVLDQLTTWERLRWWLDPRPLLQDTRSRDGGRS